jgi:hypothetical protein
MIGSSKSNENLVQIPSLYPRSACAFRARDRLNHLAPRRRYPWRCPVNYPQSIPAAYSTESNLELPYYQVANLERAYRLGWNHGHGIACHNVPSIGDSIDRSIDWIGLGKTVTADNIAEYHEALCFAAESNSREFSPFEFIAHEFNESDDSESLWEAFEAGIADSIREDLKSYSYAIEA